ERQLDGIDGAAKIPVDKPLGPSRAFGQPLLGTVGPVTKEILKESKGKYEVGDELGLSGLQQRYEDRLAGQHGVTVRAVNTDSGTVRELFSVKPKSGKPLKTTLDLAMQKTAEHVLSDVDEPSALVAIRPSNGHVLTAATGPGSDGAPTATVGQ